MKDTEPTCPATGHKQYNQSKAYQVISGLKTYSKQQTDDLHAWECPECGKWHVGHFSKYIQYLERMEKSGQLHLAR